MALIAIPSVPAAGSQLRLVRFDNPLRFFGGGEVIVSPPEAVWALTFQLRPQRLDNTRDWAAALVQLSKLSNTFRVQPPGWYNGVGFAGSNPTVNGASQLGTSLILSGTAATTFALAGDFIEVNGECKMLTQDLISNGAGAMTAYFEPALRTSPLSTSEVDVKTPKITMRLTDPVMDIAAKLAGFYDISIDAIEHYGP